MKLVCRSGASIAAAAASLILAGAAVAPMSHAAEAKGHCIGANACKGHGAGGHNACKGKGFLVMTKEECDKIPGTTFKSARR